MPAAPPRTEVSFPSRDAREGGRRAATQIRGAMHKTGLTQARDSEQGPPRS